MDILVVNPNTTVSMTEKIRRAAERAAAPGTRIVAVNPPVGPESIEGFYDDALAVPGLLAEIAKGEAQGVSAHVIACFDDTGLDAARALDAAPVVGIGEAAFHAASPVHAAPLGPGHRAQSAALRTGRALRPRARGGGAGARAGRAAERRL